jgi:hypothetical protein
VTDPVDGHIRWVNGPQPASTHDLTFLRGGKKGKEKEWNKSSLYFKLPEGLRLVGDSAYEGQPDKVFTTNAAHDPATKELFARMKGELPLKEDVPLEGRLEIIKSMESIGAKRDATFPEEYDLISKKSCDSLIQHVDTSLQYDIDSGVELPMLSGGAEDEYESSFSPSFNGGLANQYIKKLCECAELYE